MKIFPLLLVKLILSCLLQLCSFGQIMYTVAGNGETIYNGDHIPGTYASLNFPQGICFKDSINLLICDEYNHRIRNLNLNTGIITTIAGTGLQGNSGDKGQALQATLSLPLRVVVDSKSNIYFLDFGNSLVRKIDAITGVITKYAGKLPGYSFSGDGGPATDASFYIPLDIAMDKHNNLYIADYLNNRVRKVDYNTGIISTVVGNGSGTYNGDSILATNAGITPISLAIDSSDNIYISDLNNYRIRKVDQRTGMITTFAGTGISGSSGDGGIATQALINGVANISLDKYGNLYFTEEIKSIIRKINHSTKVITTIAGVGENGYNGDGLPALESKMARPGNLLIGNDNQIFIADKGNNRVRIIDNSCYEINCPNVFTFIGSGQWDSPGNWFNGNIPPSPLPKGSKIIIDPLNDGDCIMNSLQILSYGSHLIIKPNKRIKLTHNTIIN